MASRSDLLNAHEQCVAVAVQRDSFDVLYMAGGVTLAPVLSATARPEGYASAGKCSAQCLVIHPAQHEHLAVVVLLDDNGEQSVAITLKSRRNIGIEAIASHLRHSAASPQRIRSGHRMSVNFT